VIRKMVVVAYQIERIVASCWFGLLAVLFAFQIFVLSRLPSKTASGTKFYYHRFGCLAAVLGFINALDPNELYGVYNGYRVPPITYRNCTIILAYACFSATFFSIRSFYEIEAKPVPKWIKPLLIAFMVVTTIIANIFAIISVVTGDLTYTNIFLIWLFILCLVYLFVFNVSFYTLRRSVMNFQKPTEDKRNATDGYISAGLQSMRRYQMISSLAMSFAAIACLAIGAIGLKNGTDVPDPNTYAFTKGILMWIQCLVASTFLWFAWVNPSRAYFSKQPDSSHHSENSQTNSKKSQRSAPSSPRSASRKAPEKEEPSAAVTVNITNSTNESVDPKV